MEATFDIHEETLEVLRLEAERSGKTMSALVESALQMALPQGLLLNRRKTEPQPQADSEPLPPLPTWNSGGFLVDISNRDELYRVLDDNPQFRKLYGYTPNAEADKEE